MLGLLFIILSNYFRILTPQVTGYVVNSVDKELQVNIDAKKAASAEGAGATSAGVAGAAEPVRQKPGAVSANTRDTVNYDILVRKFIRVLDARHATFGYKVAVCGITLLVLALISGFFLFLMRQTIIVMSRHIEYDQKKEIYDHYQQLDTNFYKTHSTGDLMSRMAEDVSRVRMYTGPAMMYLANLLVTIGFSLVLYASEGRSPEPVCADAAADPGDNHLLCQYHYPQTERAYPGPSEQSDDQCAGILQRDTGHQVFCAGKCHAAFLFPQQ